MDSQNSNRSVHNTHAYHRPGYASPFEAIKEPRRILHILRRSGVLITLTVAAALGLGLAAPAKVANQSNHIAASFDSSTSTLTVHGDQQNNTIIVSRDATGTILVNGGTVPIIGGPSTVANTSLISVSGLGGDDTLSLDEANGVLPQASLLGGNGRDVLTGGSGADTLKGQSGGDTLLGNGGSDILDGGPSDNAIVQIRTTHNRAKQKEH